MKLIPFFAAILGVVVCLSFSLSRPSQTYKPYYKPLFSDLTPATHGTVSLSTRVAPPPFITPSTINSDSVGFAIYDYGSNGSSKRTILNYGDGT